MNKLIIALSLLIASAALAGGDVGNETVRPDGRPNSTGTKPCDSMGPFAQFKASLISRPEYAGFMNRYREFYPPLYLEMAKKEKSVVVCQTSNDINRAWPEYATTEPRMALWIPDGEGRGKNVLIINTQSFFNSRVRDSERAATIIREFSHSLFGDILTDSSNIAWMKHSAIYDIHQALVTGSDYQELIEKLNRYKMIRRMGPTQDGSYDLAVGCASSLQDCVRTLNVTMSLNVSRFELMNEIAIAANWDELSYDVTEYLWQVLTDLENKANAFTFRSNFVTQLDFSKDAKKTVQILKLINPATNGRIELYQNQCANTRPPKQENYLACYKKFGVEAASKFSGTDVNGANEIIQEVRKYVH